MNKPLKKIRAGAICATIWENKKQKDGQDIVFQTISIDRSYTDQQGTWQNTNSLRSGDLPKAALVLNKAYEFLMLGQQLNTTGDTL